jgi:2-methylcitrate dehydratase PrpD
MGLTYEVAKFVTGKGFRDFSKEEISITKDLVLDCLGVMIGAANEKVIQGTIQYVREGGQGGESGVIAGKFRTSPSDAALINGTAAHAQELESEGLYSGSLPMTIIPVALSIAEKYKLSGKAVIEGIMIGLELETKMGLAGPGLYDRGFASIGTFGTLGAAATAGKMLNLSVEQLQNMFGIGIAQCSGQARQQGSMGHLLETGLACRNGATAALLAKEGITSDPNLIEGDRGFYDLFCSGGRGYDLEKVIPSLGQPFCITSPGIIIKKYGCCFFAHRGMDALQQLIAEHDIRYEDVETVRVDVPVWISKLLLRFPEPKNCEETQFSLQQCIGSVLVDRKPDLPYLRPFSDPGAVDPKYQEARKKVTWKVREEWSSRSLPWSMPITVNMKNGGTYTKTVDKVKGDPADPLSKEELISRHQNLVQGFLSPKQTQRSIELVFSLENLKDISELMKIATFGKSKK